MPFELTIDPAWPWSLPRIGLPLLAILALALAALTIWTYRDSPSAGRRRIAIVVALRLLALLLAVITVVRPAAAFRDDLKSPSTLIIAADASRSMTIADEVDNKSRWATLQRILRQCQPQLDRLRDEFNVTVALHRFAEEVGDYDPDGAAAGARTDFGRMLNSLFQRYAQERRLRGLLILSDGADNGTAYPAQSEAARWRSLGCPISTFALGRSDTSSQQRDIALTSLTPEPAPAPVKSKLTVRATLDAPGFETAKVRLHLLIGDDEVLSETVGPLKTAGTEVALAIDAPPTPGEYKLTLRADALPGEASQANNEISTYLTVTKEGLSVLLVDRLRTELKFIRSALAGDPRIRVYEAVRQTDDPPRGGDDTFRFDKQAYDVIVLGDVTARRLRSADPKSLEQIEDLVKNKGVGLLMTGGADSFGNSDWAGTPVAAALPVELDARGQVDEPVKMLPTQAGLSEYVMRLTANPADNEAVWQRLPALDGFTRLGRLKPGAITLAASPARVPLLVRQDYGKGRTMALAVDTTWLWTRLGLPQSTEGADLHARFWKQLMIYLAQQEDRGGSAWIKPDVRRVAAGGKLGFSVGLRGKTGIDLTDARFEVQVTPPDGAPPESIAVAREGSVDRGFIWKTDKPGEYVLSVTASGTDVDKTTIGNQKATARFLVFQDDTELLRQAMDEDFLKKLATTGGGKFYRADELPKVLADLAERGIADGQHKARYWPDWRQSQLGGFIPTLFLLFVLVLGLEWGLRRHWGMV